MMGRDCTITGRGIIVRSCSGLSVRIRLSLKAGMSICMGMLLTIQSTSLIQADRSSFSSVEYRLGWKGSSPELRLHLKGVRNRQAGIRTGSGGTPQRKENPVGLTPKGVNGAGPRQRSLLNGIRNFQTVIG